MDHRNICEGHNKASLASVGRMLLIGSEVARTWSNKTKQVVLAHNRVITTIWPTQTLEVRKDLGTRVRSEEDNKDWVLSCESQPQPCLEFINLAFDKGMW